MIDKIKNICCIGAGYVGGPTMAVIADKCPHIQVNVVDVNQSRINSWNSADLKYLPIYEPELAPTVQRSRGRNLHFSTNVKEKIGEADMIFISVNTPTKLSGIGAGQASDLKWVESSARQIAKYAQGETIVVEKSTLPVKTAETIKKILSTVSNNNKEITFNVLSNPEFLAEGTAINDLKNPDRVLIGGENDESINYLKDIYLNWVEEEKILTTNLWSSELSKLIANAFLAQRISSINSISALCEVTGADIKEVSRAIGMDSRIGGKFLNSGPGFGGSCFKKDILNLVYICNYYGLKKVASYWQKVIDINDWQQERISSIIVKNLFGTISSKTIGILGFSFKANTNDTRESPAISICKDLIIEGANLQIFDPQVSEDQIATDLESEPRKDSIKDFDNFGWISCNDIYDAAKNADALVIITEWEEFKKIDWQKISNLMRPPSWVFDTRSIVNKKIVLKNGLNIWQIGN